MKFTYNWLKKHLEIHENYLLSDVCNKLDGIGLEVEVVVDYSAIYENFVVAEIVETQRHPNADTLAVCKVKYDENTPLLQVVCGAPNARAGIKVVLAKVGAVVPNGNFLIKKSKIRGVESEGMLCSADELNLSGDDVDGIIELSSDAQIGMSFSKYKNLDDAVIEIAITPNHRQSCASVFGIARDLSSANIGKVKEQKIEKIINNIECKFSVEIQAPEFCSEFNVFLGNNIDVTTPQDKYIKIVSFLSNVGKFNENPLVNIGNFAMLDMGRPAHIYDSDKISGDKIFVRLSVEGEKFIAIGGKDLVLPEGIVVICDDKKILCIGGVIGGENSKVDGNTKNILVEIANFSQEKIAFAAQKLFIRNDSQFRFEGRIDLGITDVFSDNLLSLLSKTFPAASFSNLKKFSGNKLNYKEKINFSLQGLIKYIGITATADEVELLLSNLHFNPKRNGDSWELSIPTWKQGDINTTEDIIEEVLRIGLMEKLNNSETASFGNRITKTAILINTGNSYATMHNHRVINESTESQLRNVLLTRGLDEVITWSFYSENVEKEFLMNEHHLSEYIGIKLTEKEIINIHSDFSANFTIMRRSVVPNLVKILINNINNNNKIIEIFEIGELYGHSLDNNEATTIAGLRYGDNKTFYDVRDDVLAIMGSMGMSNKMYDYKYDHIVPPYYGKKSCRIKLGNKVLAFCGELKNSIFLHSSPVLLFEIFMQNIPEKCYGIKKKQQFIAYKHQSITRDFAFIVDTSITVDNLINSVHHLRNQYITNVEIFDVFNKKESGKKSVALRVEIQPTTNTMTESEISAISQQIIDNITKQHNAELRDK